MTLAGSLKRKSSRLLILALLIGMANATAQVAPGRYFVKFTDKNGSPYTISKPEQFLSQRSIDRRIKRGIPVTMQDLPVNPHYIDSVLNKGNIDLQVKLKWFNGIVIETIDTLALEKVWQLPFVDSANSMRVSKHAEQNDDMPEQKFLLEKIERRQDVPFGGGFSRSGYDYGYAWNHVNMIKANYLHQLGFTGQGIVVAVLDAGFYGADTNVFLQHLWDDGRLLGAVDFVHGGIPLDFDNFGIHGTLVLQCLAADGDGWFVGTAPGASYLLLKTEEGWSENIVEEYYWVAGAEFADSAGADILSTSLGYTTFDDSTLIYTYSDMDGNTRVSTIGADIAASKGMLVVNSAGNWGATDWKFMGAPSDADSVLSVGAVDSNGWYAGFSSKGPSVDGRVKPNVTAQGSWISVPVGTDSVYYISGTSFSCPIISGAAASLWSAYPDANNMTILHAIEKSASKYGSPDSLMGYGIPDFARALITVVGIEDNLPSDERVEVFPNPASEFITLQTQNARPDKWQVVLYDSKGSAVLQTEQKVAAGGMRIDVSRLPRGIYIIAVRTTGENYRSSFVKH